MRIVGKGAASPLWRGWALFVMCAVLAWSAQSIALLSSATATAFFSLAPEHSQSETLLLEPGNPVERELSGGQSHAYRLRLEAGHFARLVILQQGVGIRTTLFAPDGQKLAEVDGPYDTRGPEGVSFIANAAGEYHVEVRAVSNRQATGRYRLRLEGAR
ncbi:MAG TPA: hypothetical protein VNO70_10535, partial [Blastocatellia bacterium]|nr:hypothetical protein [Blastocatellia bacterium]